MDAVATTSRSNPILKYPESILNGMVPIEIPNINEICDFSNDDKKYLFVMVYKFHFTRNEAGYENNKFKMRQFHNISNSKKVTLRIPLLLLPYKFEFYLIILVIDKIKNTKTKIYSDNHTVNIPSFLFEPRFNINDHVQYEVANATYVRSGRIMEILENDMYKIKTDEGYTSLNNEQLIITAHKSKLYMHAVNNLFVIDIINEKQVMSDLILRRENEDEIKIYEIIQDCLYDLYVDMFCKQLLDDNHWEIEYLSNILSLNIYQFLYLPQFNYRVKCPLDGYDLFYQQQWKYHIKKTRLSLKKGMEVSPIQSVWNNCGYSCDICRIELSYFQIMYHSNTDFSKQHDYCISCIHSIIKQYYEMKPFLYEILKHQLDDFCIDEIVIYCVGKAIKFKYHQQQNEHK